MRTTVLLALALAGACGLQVDEIRPRKVGLGGGLPLTVLGKGFSGDAFLGQNQVYVRAQRCKMDLDFTAEHRAVCERVPPVDDLILSAEPRGVLFEPDRAADLRVEMNVDGRWVTHMPSLKYQLDSTPLLEGIGHASIPGGRLAFRGRLISRRPTEYRVEIGDSGIKCSVLAQLEEGNIEAIAEEPGDERHYFCEPEDNEAGWYNVTVAVEPDLMTMETAISESDKEFLAGEMGAAIPSQRSLPDLFKMSVTGEAYQVIHYPYVESYAPVEGSTLGGTIVTLKGSGFANEAENTTVTIGGSACEVVSSTSSAVECVVPPGTPLSTPCNCCPCDCCKAGSAGLLAEEWYGLKGAPEAAGENAGDADGGVLLGDKDKYITPAILASNLDGPPDTSTVWGDDLTLWDRLLFGTHFQTNGETLSGVSTRFAENAKVRNVGRRLSGFFDPPYTGTYRFYVSGDDFVQLRMVNATTGKVEVVAQALASDASREGRYYNKWGHSGDGDGDGDAVGDGDGDGDGDGAAKVGPITAGMQLTKGTPVYLEVLHADHTGDNFFHVGVSHSPPSEMEGVEPYQTVPAMATVATTDRAVVKVNGMNVVLNANSKCDEDVGGAVEKVVGKGWHVLGSARKEETGGCRFFIQVFRPRGKVEFSGEGVETLCEGSMDWYYEPIPLSMLRLPVRAGTKHPIVVTSNGVPAVHNSSAGMAFGYRQDYAVSASSVSQTGYVGQWAEVQLSSAVQVDLTHTTITIGGVPCDEITASPGKVSCKVPVLDAGSHQWAVHLGPHGRPQGGPWQLRFPLHIQSLSAITGSPNGGHTVTLQGQGFDVNDTVVTVGDKPCAVLYATKVSVACVTPPGAGVQSVVAKVKDFVSNAVSYAYDAFSSVTLSSMDTTADSSGNQTITLIGAFPIARQELAVKICPVGKYGSSCRGCQVTSHATDKITCTSPVLTHGQHEVRVLKHGYGWSNSINLPINFVVQSMEPKEGSLKGGTLVTFAGKGFNNNTFVMVGPITEVGLVCHHREVSDERLVCQVARNDKQYRGNMTVRVYANEEESYEDGIHAECPGCVLDMKGSRTLSVSYSGSRTLTIRGETLTDVLEVRAGPSKCEVAEQTGTVIKCTFPISPSGEFFLDVTTRYGFADISRNAKYTFPLKLKSIEPATGSLGGGTRVTISGEGFHVGKTKVEVGDKECEVTSTTPGEVVCITNSSLTEKGGYATVSDVKVHIEKTVLSANLTGAFQYSRQITPEVTSIASGAVQDVSSPTPIVINGKRFPEGNFTVTIGDIPCVVQSSTATEITCRPENLHALTAPPTISSSEGISIASDGTSITVAPGALQLHTSTTVGALGGRLSFSLPGMNLLRPSDIEIKVDGFDCPLTSFTTATVDCEIPPYAAYNMQKDYPAAPGVSLPEPVDVVARQSPQDTSQDSEAAKAVDGNTTSSALIRNYKELILSTESGFVIDVREIRIFPSDAAKARRSDLVNTTIEGYSGGGWSKIASIDKPLHVGWNKLPMSSKTVVQHIRFWHNSSNMGFAEIKVVGYKLAESPTGRGVVALRPSFAFPIPPSSTITRTFSVNYSPLLTPVITSFEPPYGTAAGGDLLVIGGSNFMAGSTVVIDGSECVVQAFTPTSITCRTTPRLEIPAVDKLGVFVNVPGRGRASVQTTPFLYADKWSSPLTWRDGIVPREGDTVILTRGRNVILDESPPRLFFMLIDGSLIFSDTTDLSLELNYILIRGGRLQIGTKDKPFGHKATITLHGDRHSTIPLPIYGTKNIAVRGGEVELYGQPKTPTWTRLGATAKAGATSITLRQAVNWQVGDEIVIAPGSYSYREAETRVITAISQGTTLSFSEPLQYEHFGEVENHYGTQVDMACEVGVLSRSIRIQGDEDSWKQKFGAHMMFHSPSRPVTAQLHYVEFHRVGQAKIIGRYPIHFHLEGDRPENVLVKGCSIHKSWNRAIVLHDTSHVTIEHNVAYDAMGHMYFVEDGSEMYNTFYRNLGIGAKPTGGQLSHDVFTSVFWMANPQNNFIENAAAGSSHMGFWISPPKHPRRMSFTETRCPHQLPLGEMRGNTAHSNGRHGFWVHPGHFAREVECGSEEESENPFVVSRIQDLTSWKNNEQGVGLVSIGGYVLDNVVTIDCNDAGIEIGDISGEPGVTLQNSVMIAHSSRNRPREWKLFRSVTGYRGLIVPKSEGFRGIGLTFIGFKDNVIPPLVGGGARHAGVYTCCRCWNDCSSEMGAFSYRFRNTQWFDCPNRVNFGWPHKDIIVDEDGTFLGTPTNPAEPMSTMLPKFDYLMMPGCVAGATPHTSPRNFGAYTGERAAPAMICPPNYAFHRAIVHEFEPVNMKHYTFAISTKHGFVEERYDESKDRPISDGWSFPVATSTDPTTAIPFRIYYGNWQDWRQVTIWVTEMPWNPFKRPLQLDLNYSTPYALFDIVPVQWYNKLSRRRRVVEDVFYELGTQLLSPEKSLLDVYNPEQTMANMDPESKVLSLIFSGTTPDISLPARSQLARINPIQCPTVEGKVECIGLKPEVAPEVKMWSDPTAWEGAQVPKDGETAFIPRGRTIILSGTTAKLNLLVVQGELHFDRDSDCTLQSVNIFIQGGKMEIGNSTHPYLKQGRIIILGTINTPTLSVDNDHWLGSGAFAVFGRLTMNGADKGKLWTKLAKTSRAGSNTVELQEEVAWETGSKVWITSTGYDSEEAEVATITGKEGRVLTLDKNLQHTHLGETADGLPLYGEVGLLSHNIKITSAEDNTIFGTRGANGCHMVFGKLSSSGQFEGQGEIRNVEFSHCGHYGTDRGTVLLQWLKKGTVVLDRVSMWNNNAYAVRSLDLEGIARVVIRDSVMYRSRSSTVWVTGGEGQTEVIGNLVGNTQLEGDGNTRELSCSIVTTKNNTVARNVAAGSWAEGICYYGMPCGHSTEGNEAHSSAHGFYLYSRSWCTELKAHAWRNSYLGVFSMLPTNIRLVDSLIHNNHIGVDFIITGGRRRTVRIMDSTIAGASPSAVESCEKQRCLSFRTDKLTNPICEERSDVSRRFTTASIGMLMTQSREKPYHPELKRAVDVPLPYDSLGMTAPYGSVEVHNVTFRNFFTNGKCGGDAVVATVDEARAHIVPHAFSEITFVSVDNDAKVFFHNPSRSWRTGEQCGEGWDCSGLQQALITGDGTFFGQGVEGTGGAVVSVFDGVANPACTRNSVWNAHFCPQNFGELFVRSLDEDHGERRIYPLRVQYPEGRFFLVNQPPDLYMQSEWPSFFRPGWFWAAVETGYTLRIDFGDLPPRRSVFELNQCANPKGRVLVTIHYPEPLRLQVWLDPENNETGRTPPAESMVTMEDEHSANYFEGGEARLLTVVLQCGKSFEVHQLVMVRVAMRLDMSIEEFYDKTSSEQFANNIAMMLGIPKSRIRIVEIQSGSVIVRFQIEGEDSQEYSPKQQNEELQKIADKLGNYTKQELEEGTGVPVAAIEELVVSPATPGSCQNGTSSDPSLCKPVDDDDSFPSESWHIGILILAAAFGVGVIGMICILFGKGSDKVSPKELDPSVFEESEAKQDDDPTSKVAIVEPDEQEAAEDFPDYDPQSEQQGEVKEEPTVVGYESRLTRPEDRRRLRSLKINLQGDASAAEDEEGAA